MTTDNISPPGAWQKEIDRAPWRFKKGITIDEVLFRIKKAGLIDEYICLLQELAFLNGKIKDMTTHLDEGRQKACLDE